MRLAAAAVLALTPAAAGAAGTTVTTTVVEERFPSGANDVVAIPGGTVGLTATAVGGRGGGSAEGGLGGLGAALTGTVAVPSGGGSMRVLVATNGTTGTLEGSAPGGWPLGGAGVSGGGGGGGFSAICPEHFTPGSGMGACSLVAGGGGGGGHQPVSGANGRGGEGFIGSTGLGESDGEDGTQYGSAGGGHGGRGGGRGGEAGLPGSGPGAELGEEGQPGEPNGAGGRGGRGGTFGEGGGGGGGAGLLGGGGGGGGGSCGADAACVKGFAGGGGGGGGGSTAGQRAYSFDPQVIIYRYQRSSTGAAFTTTSTPTSSLTSSQTTVGTVQSLSGGQGGLVSLGCGGPVTSNCELSLSLSATETVSGGRVIAVAAGAGKHRRAKVEHRTVMLARGAVTLIAGQSQSVAIRLDDAGRALLARRHHLTVELAVAQTDAQGKQRALATRTLTLTAATG